MANSTKLVNRNYANIGDVKIIFNDDTSVTHSINAIDTGNGDSPTVGTYFDQNSSRTPVSVEALGTKWFINELPSPITYPNNEIGEISYSVTDSPWSPTGIVWLDEV